jgi:hypothetical protein
MVTVSVSAEPAADVVAPAPVAPAVDASPLGAFRSLRGMVLGLRPRLLRKPPVPVTIAYTVVLLVLGTLLQVENDRTQTRILFHLSTNLHNLLHGHFATLISSAFVTDGPAWMMVPLLACVLVLAEIRLGSRRLVEIFLTGHIGATLLVAVGLYIGVQAEWLDGSVVRAQDVGVSYGTMALIGVFTVLVPPRWRLRWAQLWLLLAALGIGLQHTFTNVGHFTALAIGLLMAVVMIRKNWLPDNWTRALSRFETVLLVASGAIGACFLLA